MNLMKLIYHTMYYHTVQFPIVAVEPSEKEIVEYYGPKDFKIGATINVFGRRFLIYDMDECTKQFYRDHFGYTDFQPICVEDKKEIKKDVVKIIINAMTNYEKQVF